MRPDMAKVVTEAPRRGSGERNRKSALKIDVRQIDRVYPEESHGIDYDDGPRRHKMLRYFRTGHGYGEGKDFSDVLGPLKKYLRKQVGRPWDHVYSELSANLDKRSISGLHIWDHVWQFVERCCVEIDGRIYTKHGVRWRWAYPHGTVTGLYVHPRTGLLCYAPEPSHRYRPKVDPDVVKIDKFYELRRLEGIWYHCWLGIQDRYVPARIIKNGYVVHPAKFVEELVLQRKKQLNRKELREHKLQNAVQH